MPKRLSLPIAAAIFALCSFACAPVLADPPPGSPLPFIAAATGAPQVVSGPKLLGSDTSARWYHIVYRGREGDPVPAILTIPIDATAAKPAPAMLLVHGLGSNKEQMLPVARLLAQSGYASLAIDLPQHGERREAQQPAFTTAAGFGNMVQSVFARSVDDLTAGLDYLQTRPEINRNKFGLIGISLGGMIGADTSGDDPRIRTTILIAAGGGLGDIITYQARSRVSYGGSAGAPALSANADTLNHTLAPIDPLTWIPKIAPRPLLMENGAADPIVPPAAAQRLYAAAGQPKHFDSYPGQGHIPDPMSLFAAIQVFLGKTLPV